MFRHVRKLFETRVAVEIEIDVNKVVLLTWVPCLQQKLCLSLKRRCYFLCKREKVRSIRVIENAWLLWWCFLGDDRYPRDRFFRSKTHKAFARWILNFHKILSPRLKITIIFTVWQREEWLEDNLVMLYWNRLDGQSVTWSWRGFLLHDWRIIPKTVVCEIRGKAERRTDRPRQCERVHVRTL